VRACAYLRCSTSEQAEEGLSLEFQEAAVRKAAKQAGTVSLEVFCDAGYTGMKLKRPALQKLLTRLPEFDLLLVWRVDRLARPLRHRLELLDTCMDAGVAFRSCTENIDLDTIIGKAMVQMMGVFAELEVGQLRERVRAALAHRAAQGLTHG
jgi:site-specific DNA recombinase